jgi:hypothetical protein
VEVAVVSEAQSFDAGEALAPLSAAASALSTSVVPQAVAARSASPVVAEAARRRARFMRVLFLRCAVVLPWCAGRQRAAPCTSSTK